MRTLPPTKLVKNDEHGPDFSSYDVLTLFDDMKLGEVFRASGQPTWTACFTVDHPQYGAGIKVAGHRRTRSEGVELVAQAWMASIDEVTAHKFNNAMINGTRDAELRAEECRFEDDTRPLTYADGGELSFSTSALEQSIKVVEHDLRNIISGKSSFFAPTPEALYELANKLHFMKLELVRRERVAKYEVVIPSGDYREEPTTPQGWRAQARELARKLGRVEANALVPQAGGIGPYKSLDDLDLRDSTTRARERLEGVWGDSESYLSTIQQRALVYQALLNESHERALGRASLEEERTKFRRFLNHGREIGALLSEQSYPHRSRRCEANARKGTGTGLCDTVLSVHGICLNAGDHIEES